MRQWSVGAVAFALAVLRCSALPSAWAEPSAPTPTAQELVEEIRAELRPVEEQIRHHPYLEALEAGKVSRDNLRAFAGEQYHILTSDLRSDAHMVARFGATPGAAFFLDLVNGEAIAIGLLRDFAAALGLTEADLQAYEPRPRGQTYPHYAAWLGFYAAAADIAAAYLVNFPVFGENTGRMGAALRSRYGFTAEHTAFFDFFAALPPSFEPAALAIIEAGLDSGVEPRTIKRAARLLQAYEKDFWDAVAETE
jgi:pyrroloquinoline quinone (PQQ) biosynthesis protein C